VGKHIKQFESYHLTNVLHGLRCRQENIYSQFLCHL